MNRLEEAQALIKRFAEVYRLSGLLGSQGNASMAMKHYSLPSQHHRLTMN